MTTINKVRLVTVPVMILCIIAGGLTHDLTSMTFTANSLWFLALVCGLTSINWDNLS